MATQPIEIKYCSHNEPPRFLSPPKSTDAYYICAGDSFCLPIAASDPDSLRDSIIMTWKGNMTGAALPADNKLGSSTATFCWTPDASHVSTTAHELTLYISDNFKPCVNKDSLHLKLYVTPAVNASFTASPSFTEDRKFYFQPADLTFDTYKWDFGDGITSTAIKPAYTYAKDSLYTVTLTVGSTSGCEKTFTQTVIARSCHTNVSPVVTADNGTYSYTICAGDSLCIPVTATDTDTLENLTLNWNKGIASGVFTATGPKGTFCWKPKASDVKATPHTFSITANDNFRTCPATGAASFSIDVVPPPDASFTVNSGSAPTYTFIPNDSSHTSYLWTFGDGNHSTSISPQHTFSANDTYLVILTVTNSAGCIESDTLDLLVLGTSVENVKVSAPGWKVYPNPLKGNKLIIETTHPLSSPATIELYDLKGSKVFQTITTESKTELKLPEGMVPGPYMLRINTDNTYIHEILIK